MSSIPFIDLSPSVKRVQQKSFERWKEQVDNCEFIGGKTIAEFEERLAQKLGVAYAVGCSNGTDALVLALQASGVKPGWKVALPNITFWASFEAIVVLGATPVLIDINLEDGQMSYEEYSSAFEKHQFQAVVFPHLFGLTSAKLEDFREHARNNEILFIEDSAQAFGVTYKGDSVFQGAFASSLSFYPAKVLGGCMDGGAVLTDSEEIAFKVRKLLNHGRLDHYSYDEVGWNARMAAMNAAFLLEILKISEQLIDERRAAWSFYRDFFRENSLDERNRFLDEPPGVKSNGYLCSLLLDGVEPEKVQAELQEKGIRTARTYPATMCSMPPAKEAIKFGSLSSSKEFCRRVMNLPLYAGISLADCERAATELVHIVSKD